MWGDISPISGRVLANLPVASDPGQANNDPGTGFTLPDTNVSLAHFVAKFEEKIFNFAGWVEGGKLHSFYRIFRLLILTKFI